jgi:transposase InsO family protein
MLSQQDHYPVRVICRVLDLPRSTYYQHSKETNDQDLQEAIEAILEEFSTYGSRRVVKQLRRPPYNIRINRKLVQRLMRNMGLQQPQKRRTCHTTNSRHTYPRYPNLIRELKVVFPDQVWVCDITYIRLRNEFIYLAVIMDVFTRSIRGWHLSRSLDQQLTLIALRQALADHVPLIHHSDQGVQYAATVYTDLLASHGVQISMAQVGIPEENGFAERLLRTIKEEEVNLSEYHDFEDAFVQIGHFIEQVYQHKRIHSALGYLTPVEFEAAWQRQQIDQESLKPA